jgi:hypothetical protein
LHIEGTYKLTLRNALHLATLELEGQVARIEALRECPGHSLQLLLEMPRDLANTVSYSCHAYSLGLLPPYPQLDSGDVLKPSADFVSYLLASSLITVLLDHDARPGDLALYYEDSLPSPEIVHSGVHQGDRIRSKWGHGHVWLHEPFETPATYGCRLEFARVPTNLKEHWTLYLKQLAAKQAVAAARSAFSRIW